MQNQETIEGTREQASDFEEDSEQEWDATNTHELALQLGKEVEVSSLASTVLRTGWKMAENIPLGEGFQNLKKVGDALRSGEDQGVKEAASAALRASRHCYSFSSPAVCGRRVPTPSPSTTGQLSAAMIIKPSRRCVLRSG